MHHLRRITDETFGLVCAVVVLLASLNDWRGVADTFAVILVIFFLFRLTIGKPHIPAKSKR